jgi:hypothetical protein
MLNTLMMAVGKIRTATGDDLLLSGGGARRELKPVLKARGIFEFKGWVELDLLLSARIDVFHNLQVNLYWHIDACLCQKLT